MYTIKVLDTVRVIVDPQKFLVLPGSSPILYLITMESKCLKDNIKYEELELNETYQVHGKTMKPTEWDQIYAAFYLQDQVARDNQ